MDNGEERAMESRTLPQVVAFNRDKHLPQSSADKTNDLFYMLATLFIAANEEKNLTKLNLQKILFRTMQDLGIDNNISFLRTFFYINTYGPFNNMFYKYLQELQDGNLIEMSGNNVYLTVLGLNTIQDMIDTLPEDAELIKVLVALKKYVDSYSGDGSGRAIRETHALQVEDLTDNGKVKTIQDIINHIQPQLQFRSGTNFKYIDPFDDRSNIERVDIPPKFINTLENVIAKVKEEDYEEEGDLAALFI